MLGITGLGFEQKASRVQSYARKERRREEKIGSGTIKRRDVDGDSGGEDSGSEPDRSQVTKTGSRLHRCDRAEDAKQREEGDDDGWRGGSRDVAVKR
ncbi:hypothetical protein AFLA70_147g002232 [Aspergillus flavus AF70]|nr:hypothetical protein AFLA70_147g002232 [Aspergillus flavus AF70]